MSKKCSRCGATVDDDQRFCQECGNDLGKGNSDLEQDNLNDLNQDDSHQRGSYYYSDYDYQRNNQNHNFKQGNDQGPYNRKEVKLTAKQALFGNYWPSIILFVFTITVSFLITFFCIYIQGGMEYLQEQLAAGNYSFYGSFTLLSIALGLVLSIVDGAYKGWSCLNYQGKHPKYGDYFAFYKKGFNLALCYILTNILVTLWTFLFIIPGIIKSFSYSMAPYLVAEYDLGPLQAIRLSKKMMRGYKFDLFVLTLSFIGLILLSAITFYILMIIYVGPYIQTAEAGFYLKVKANALATGVISQQELETE